MCIFSHSRVVGSFFDLGDHPPSPALNHRMCVARPQDKSSCESVAFRLAAPLCLVNALQVRPFRAFFQDGKPIYAPQKVRFRLGGVPCFDALSQPLPLPTLADAAAADIRDRPVRWSGEGGAGAAPAQSSSSEAASGTWDGFTWTSPEYAFAQEDTLQTFEIPPTLCVGGYLRIDLLGRTQQQQPDERWYSELLFFFCTSPKLCGVNNPSKIPNRASLLLTFQPFPSLSLIPSCSVPVLRPMRRKAPVRLLPSLGRNHQQHRRPPPLLQAPGPSDPGGRSGGGV